MNTITKEDVLQVADELGYTPTDAQIQEVIEMYPSEQDADPTGTWNLVVEQCLSTLGVEQANPTPVDDKTELVDKVMERIKHDVELGDVTAIDEMLKLLPRNVLTSYLLED
jgi:hypothetical protein